MFQTSVAHDPSKLPERDTGGRVPSRARSVWSSGLVVVTIAAATSAGPTSLGAVSPQARATEAVDLARRLAAGQLRAVNRRVTALAERAGGVHVTAAAGPGVVWIDGTDVSQGTIALQVRGRNVPQQSFLGVAFHRQDDTTYEAVYLRPFNFRATDPASHQHAIQYIAVPDFDWPRLRRDFPEEFENPVDASVSPTDWVPLRVVVSGARIQIFVGSSTSAALDARKLGSSARGPIGLWVGNNSDGDFADLRVAR